jgi:hypothetical protein
MRTIRTPIDTLRLEEKIAQQALDRSEADPLYYPIENYLPYVRRTIVMLNRKAKVPDDIDPLDELEAIQHCSGQTQNLAMNAYRAKLQNTLRITHSLICEVSWTGVTREARPDRIYIEWVTSGNARRREYFFLDQIEKVVERLLSINKGEKVATSMGLTIQPGPAKIVTR